MYLGLDTSHTTCILTTYFTTAHWIHKMYNNTIIQHVYNSCIRYIGYNHDCGNMVSDEQRVNYVAHRVGGLNLVYERKNVLSCRR